MAKLNALLCISRHFPNDFFRPGSAAGRKRETARVQHVNGDGKSFPVCSKHMIDRHFHVFIQKLRLCRATNAELPNCAEHFESRHVWPDNERRRAHDGFTASLDRSLRERRYYSGAVTVSNPDLVAVEDPLRSVVRKRRCRLDVLRVRSRLWLGERIRGQRFAASEHRQVARLLFVVPVKNDGLRPEAAVNANKYRQ